MDFELSEEHKMMQAMVKDFATTKIAPKADEIDKKQEFPMDNFKMLGDMGLLGIGIPPEYGGSGGDELSFVIAGIELAKACASTADIFDAHLGLCVSPIYINGNEDQRKKFVTPLAQGKKIGAMGVTESDAGSDVSSVKTTAVRDGDYYILNGSKIFITNGDVCDTILVFASIPKLAPRGMTAFIVEKGTPGYSVGKKYDKVGMRAATNTEQIFEDCRVPAANRLGEEGKGMRLFLEMIDRGRIGIGAQGLGVAEAAIEKTIEYAKTRKQFGNTISSYQGISFRIADMVARLEQARLMIYKAAWLADNKKPYHLEASIAKLTASELAMQAAWYGMQVYGGYGYMMDSPMQRYFRDAKLIEIYEGTSEIQRMVIAAEVLK